MILLGNADVFDFSDFPVSQPGAGANVSINNLGITKNVAGTGNEIMENSFSFEQVEQKAVDIFLHLSNNVKGESQAPIEMVDDFTPVLADVGADDFFW